MIEQCSCICCTPLGLDSSSLYIPAMMRHENERLVADSDDESAHLRIDRSEARRWEMMSSCPCEGMQWRSWTANSRIGSMMRHLK